MSSSSRRLFNSVYHGVLKFIKIRQIPVIEGKLQGAGETFIHAKITESSFNLALIFEFVRGVLEFLKRAIDHGREFPVMKHDKPDPELLGDRRNSR